MVFIVNPQLCDAKIVKAERTAKKNGKKRTRAREDSPPN